ncbi:hypothetical protein JOS77_13240 [Chromobacterium haemolyticum]|nr:hypothetical protein JOS77_13240 [Chromobacterium haemolyticum]
MRIYIDESGSFATAEEARNPLSVVVAVAFDEIHIPKIESIINETKKRTLCSSELKIDSFKNGKDFVKFLKILKKYNPTIIIAAANTSEKLVGFYREIRDYDIEHLENESFLCHKTAQQYIQGLIFFDLINASLWALAEKVSKEIEINNKNKYQWIIDEKGKSYENFTKANIAKYTSGIGVNFEYRLIKPPLCALYEKYGWIAWK